MGVRGLCGKLGPGAILSLAVACGGCGLLPTEPPPEADRLQVRAHLEGAVASLEEVALEALAALPMADTTRLERVRLTEYEHNELVWPQLPASAPEVNFPVDWAWLNISLRNRRALRRLMWRFEGRDLGLLAVYCFGGIEEFETFRVHKDCWVRLTVDGEEVEPQQIFKYVLDWDGQFKVFRYYDD